MVASHGRVPADVLLPNSIYGCIMLVKVPYAMWGAPLSPGSWRGGSWVSALLIRSFAPSLRSCCDVWLACVVCFARSYPNSLAHKLPAWFVCFAFGFTPVRIPDCIMVRAPFLTPQCGMLIHALSNSFISKHCVEPRRRRTEKKVVVTDERKDAVCASATDDEARIH